MIGTRLRAWWTRYQRWRRPSALRDVVRKLVHEADRLPASGEYKRHVVYAELIKQYYPKWPKRHLAWLIEDVIRESYEA